MHFALRKAFVEDGTPADQIKSNEIRNILVGAGEYTFTIEETDENYNKLTDSNAYTDEKSTDAYGKVAFKSISETVREVDPYNGKHRYFVKKIQVTVWAPVLRGAVVQGAGDLLIPDGLATDAFEAVVKGAGNLSVGEMDVDGKVSFLIQGAGDIRAEAVEAETLGAEVQGAGGITLSGIDATDVSAVIKGAGGIVLSGKAGSAVLKLLGAGSIDIRALKADNYDVSRSGIGKVKR